MLIRYFGEISDEDCKSCDVCLRKSQSGLRNWEFNTAHNALREILEKKRSVPVNKLAVDLPLEKEKNLQVIRFVLDHGDKIYFKDGVIYLEK
jgi:ATP-dependent DNA helicase RecQ